MIASIKKFLNEKRHIIVVTILSVYLLALTVKTAHLYYTEYWLKKDPPVQAQKTGAPN